MSHSLEEVFGRRHADQEEGHHPNNLDQEHEKLEGNVGAQPWRLNQLATTKTDAISAGGHW